MAVSIEKTAPSGRSFMIGLKPEMPWIPKALMR